MNDIQSGKRNITPLIKHNLKNDLVISGMQEHIPYLVTEDFAIAGNCRLDKIAKGRTVYLHYSFDEGLNYYGFEKLSILSPSGDGIRKNTIWGFNDIDKATNVIADLMKVSKLDRVKLNDKIEYLNDKSKKINNKIQKLIKILYP